ncbi:hypothetical protein BGZ67_008400, partial [Mortierella alpina]
MNKHLYLRIKEEAAVAPQVQKVIQLRNVANTRLNPARGEALSRAEVLECLMPLSKVPWGKPATVIKSKRAPEPSSPTRGQG